MESARPMEALWPGKQLFDAVAPDSIPTLHLSLVQSRGREHCSISQLVNSGIVEGIH